VWMYEINDLQKNYQGKKVLEIENLQLAKGKIYGIIGPSGGGKSTLLRLLNLLEKPDQGEIYYQGNLVEEDEKQRLAYRRTMAMVFQQSVLFNTTVYKNVAYGLGIRGQRGEAVKKKVAQALDLVEMEGYEKRQAITLSGGEAQRVALARTMVLEPEVLLLDEPTASLDPYNTGVVEKLVRHLNEEKGTTMVWVTHNMFQAKRLAHETLFLYENRIVEQKATEEFFQSPSDPKTQAFIEGKMIY